jgi:adenylosuccinate synthase
MASTVLIGLQFGDEGKARILDYLAKNCDVVARFNGGANAGHTIEHKDKKIILHQIPSGVLYNNVLLYIGSGCVINPVKTVDEIRHVESQGCNLNKRLFISSKTTLVLPHHIVRDKEEGRQIGTTGNGIGYAYSAQALRTRSGLIENVRIGDIIENKDLLVSVAKRLIETMNEFNLKIDVDVEMTKFYHSVLHLKQYVIDDPMFLERIADKDKKIIFEGAQSVMLDVINGTVPFVTSSRTIAAAAYTGGDISYKHHKKTIGIAKAIMSRVGNGPFVSEFGGSRSEKYCAEENGTAHTKEKEHAANKAENLLKSKDLFEVGIGLRMIGGEYGATTKRPRRIGMLDLVMLKQNCDLNGVDELYINKFDSLCDFNNTSLKGIPVVVAYKLKGKTIDYMPSSTVSLQECEPVIKYFPKMPESIKTARTKAKLPKQAKDLIKFIEKFTNTKMKGVGVGPKREEFVQL